MYGIQNNMKIYYNNNKNNSNNNNNDNDDDIMMKLIKNTKTKYFLLPVSHGDKWACLKKNVFYFSIKISNLNLYYNENWQFIVP